MSFCYLDVYFFFFFKQKTAYEMRISDWSSDVCSSDLRTDRWSRIDMRSHLPLVLAAFALTAPYSAKAAPASHGTHHVDAALEAALKAPTRTHANVARDRYRPQADTPHGRATCRESVCP